jgi:hypothetical protein
MPSWPQFCGSSDRSQSAMASPARLVNWYRQRVGNKFALYPTPGLTEFCEAPESPGRGIVSQSIGLTERVFAVIGSALYELFSDGTSTSRGTVATDQYPASMVTNGDGGDQLLIVSGNTGYILNLSTNALSSEVTDVTMAGMMDGFFLALDTASSTLKISDLLDGTTWDPTQFAQRSTAPDPWRALLVKYPRVWLLGEHTGDLWYNAGTAPFPFAPVPNAQIPYGIAASFTLKQVGSSVMWLTRNQNGDGQVVEAQGTVPTVVSNEALELAISAMRRIDDAVAYAYQEQGHTFYVINFPSGNATWVYDQTEGAWHERGSWNATDGEYEQFGPQYHTLAFDKHLVLHAENGSVYEQSISVTTDAEGALIRRLRIPPLLAKGQKRIFLGKLQLVMETGLGLSSGQGSDPQVNLRVSGDAGKTWSNTRTRSAGVEGAYNARVEYFNCGSGRNMVPEITVSDPIPWRLIDLEYEARVGAA